LKRAIGKAVESISSLRLSGACLLYSAIIVVAGTIYQVDHGLYAAQERFFRSWFFLVGGFLPLPGLQIICAVVLVNIAAAGIKRIPFRFEKIGLLLMHLGVITLIGGTGLLSRSIKESIITISKHQRMDEAVDLRHWDLSITIQGLEEGALWTTSYSSPFSALKEGQSISFPAVHKTLLVKRLYNNCEARGGLSGPIDTLLPLPPSSEAPNIPGIILSNNENPQGSEKKHDMLGWGGMADSVSYSFGNDTFSLLLLPKRVKLPISVELLDFVLEKHPGTSNAKKIQSRIRVTGDDIDREVVVSMNRPFRYRSLTFYQTGFSEGNGPRSSTLTVVENPVRFLPHAASAMIVIGLLFHFVVRFFRAAGAARGKQNA
jgi:hypothetical protein